jgi:hypothetical protein
MKLHAYHDSDGTYRYLVLAKNMKEAADLLNTTVYQIRNYGGRYPGNGPEHEMAMKLPPGSIFRKEMSPHPLAQWLVKCGKDWSNRA